MIDLVIRWNNAWRHDYWWRQKYNIAFNSEQHRQANPVDIKFEHTEYVLSKRQEQLIELQEHKRKRVEEGVWIEERRDEKREKELFDKVDLSQF